MKTIILLFALAVMVGVGFMLSHKNTPGHFTYVITETGIANSFDPLDADQTLNMPVARMIYATPIEVDHRGNLKSSLLDSFDYDEKTMIMTWKVKSGLTFSDGSPIKSTDIAFAVARMVYTRPTFPVIENIEGLQKWIKLPKALASFPSGINVSENTITIKFNKKQDHPLFRFCLEIFSVIPKSCVDFDTNKIICEKIPTSGHYQIAEKKDSEILFEKRNQKKIFESLVPDKIHFKYLANSQAIELSKNLDSKTIIAGSELRYSIEEMAQFQKNAQVSFAPASRIVGVLLNPNVGAFNDIKCRQVFAKAFRDAFTKLVGASRVSESSVFTDLLPGYQARKDLDQDLALIKADLESCRRKFQQEPIKWLKSASNPKSIFVQVMEKVIIDLGIEGSTPTLAENQNDENSLFVSGKLSTTGFQTGFWAFDPAGDIQMLMTPNMHKSLKFVSDDQKMQNLIRRLKATGQEQDTYIELNKHIYKESLFNVFTHVRRFLVAKDRSLISEAPVSITAPAPWQYFKVE